MSLCGRALLLKCVLTYLCVLLEATGLILLVYGLWWGQKTAEFHHDVLFSTFLWVLIVQGPLMATMGAYGVYSVWKEKPAGLRVVCVFLLVLALVDIAVGTTVHMSCKRICPWIVRRRFTINPAHVTGSFLTAAALMIVFLVCSLVFMNQNRDST